LAFIFLFDLRNLPNLRMNWGTDENGGTRIILPSPLFSCPSSGSDQAKILEFKRIGSKNGRLGALNRYFDRENSRYKNCPDLSEKPLQGPSPTVGKPQKELTLMTSMGYVPHEGSLGCMAYSLWPSFDSSLDELFYP
jgi:hypothetical protein